MQGTLQRPDVIITIATVALPIYVIFRLITGGWQSLFWWGVIAAVIAIATCLICFAQEFRREAPVTRKAEDVLLGLNIFCEYYGHLPFPSNHIAGIDRGKWSWRYFVAITLHDWPRGRTVSRKDKSVLFYAVAGEGTWWTKDRPCRAVEQLEKCHLLFVEASTPIQNWLEPQDIDVVDLQTENPMSELKWCPEGIVAGFSDGWIRRLRSDIPQRLVALLATDGCTCVNGQSETLAPWVIESKQIRLLHPEPVEFTSVSMS